MHSQCTCGWQKCTTLGDKKRSWTAQARSLSGQPTSLRTYPERLQVIWVSRPEETSIAVFRVGCSDVEVSVRVDRRHLFGLERPIVKRILEDAQGVNPQVLNRQTSRYVDSIAERRRKSRYREPVLEAVMRPSCQAQQHVCAPAMAQGQISYVERHAFGRYQAYHSRVSQVINLQQSDRQRRRFSIDGSPLQASMFVVANPEPALDLVKRLVRARIWTEGRWRVCLFSVAFYALVTMHHTPCFQNLLCLV
jgi:hypothetical protein